MKRPKVSLIIPAYNEEKYIRDCLDHVVENGGDFLFEIIVVDNGSTDTTPLIVARYPSVTLVQEYKKGPASARQKGFQVATGDIVAFIDADTRMPENWCNILIRDFQDDSHLVCLSGPYFFYDFSTWQKTLIHTTFWYVGAQFISTFFSNVVVGGNFAMKREVLAKMSGFDTSLPFYGEDTDIARRAGQYGNVKFDIDFVMPTSGRRFNGGGFLKTSWLYVLNYFASMIMHRPITEDYIDFR